MSETCEDTQMTAQRTRWRSRRRRSNEKSAAQIRRETPSFWQLHTDGGPLDHDPLLWVIQRVRDGYQVLINGKTAVLPRTVRLNLDRITVMDTLVRANHSGTTRSDLWHHHPWTRQGARANYHAVVGGPVTRRSCLVLSEPFLANGGKQWCTLIEGVRGWVAVEQLSKA